MKTILLYFTFFVIGSLFGQEDSTETTVLDQLKTDSVAFNHYMLLAKCNCIDKVSKKDLNFFEDTYYELKQLRFGLTDLVSKQELLNSFEVFLSQNLDSTFSDLYQKNDLFKHYKAPMISCEKIYGNVVNSRWDQYLLFISQLEGKLNENYLNSYLNRTPDKIFW